METYIVGPFGHYQPGTMGALLNKLCRQEDVPVTTVENYTVGNGVVHARQGGPVVCRFKWIEEKVFFEWVEKRARSLWSVDFHGVYQLHTRFELQGEELVFQISQSQMPYDTREDNLLCFNELVHWCAKRCGHNDPVSFDQDPVEQTLTIKVKQGASIKTAVEQLNYISLFKYIRRCDLYNWRDSYSEEVGTRAIELFTKFSETVNRQPEQNYVSEFGHLEMRFQLAWLETAKWQLQKEENIEVIIKRH